MKQYLIIIALTIVCVLLGVVGVKAYKEARDYKAMYMNANEELAKQLGVSKKFKDKYNVLEGNRRVIAIRLLNNPELIPEKYKSILNKFTKLYV